MVSGKKELGQLRCLKENWDDYADLKKNWGDYADLKKNWDDYAV